MVSTKDIKFSSSSKTVTRGSFSGKNSRVVNNFPSSDAYSETISHRRVFIEKFFAVNKLTLVGLLRWGDVFACPAGRPDLMSFFPSVFISRVESRRFFKASRRTNRLSEERKNLVILSEEAVLQAIKEAALLLASSAVASRNLVVVSGKSKKNVGITRVLAKKYGFSFIDSRWIPGTITNYKEIRTGLIRFVNSFDRRFFLNEPLELDEETVNKSLKDDVLRLEKIAVKKVDAPAEEMYRFRKLSYLVRNFPSDSKKKLVRRYADLYRKFHGILSLHLPPSFILFLSPMNNKNALVEASNSKVPVVLLLHPGFSFFGNPVVVGGNLYTEKSVMLISSMILEPFFYLLDKEAGRDLENTKKKWLLANLFLKVEKSMDKKIEEGEKLN